MITVKGNTTEKYIDLEFAQTLRTLSNVAKISPTLAKHAISLNMDIYIQTKIDMALSKSIQKIFK
jgi:hypothetical protein